MLIKIHNLECFSGASRLANNVQHRVDHGTDLDAK